MADEIGNWEAENPIPNEDILFMRIHRNWFSDGELIPGVFHNTPTKKDGMSTDWNKYSTARDTRRRIAEDKRPEDYAVVQMVVGAVRQIPEQTVVHTPMPDNRAHTDIFGEKKRNPEVRVKFGRLVEQNPNGYVYNVDDPDI